VKTIGAYQKEEREKGRGMVGLSYEVVEGPEVVFFLDDDVFEHASCRRVAAFERFSDNLTVE